MQSSKLIRVTSECEQGHSREFHECPAGGRIREEGSDRKVGREKEMWRKFPDTA